MDLSVGKVSFNRSHYEEEFVISLITGKFILFKKKFYVIGYKTLQSY